MSLATARAGNEVYACEPSKSLCAALRESARANGVDEKLTVIQKDCRQIEVPGDLPEKVDMIVFDLFDCGLLGEGVLHYLAHAREKLAGEGVRLFPEAAVVKAMLIERRVDPIGSYDTSLMTPYLFTPDYTSVDLRKTRYRALSEPFDVFSFPFVEAGTEETEIDLGVELTDGGVLGAIVFWYELRLDDRVAISTSPFDDDHFRDQAIQFVPEVKVTAGMKLELRAKHTGSNVAFGLKGDNISKENIINQPRYDPRWMSLHMQLLQQGQQMMQQLQANPEEYRKVVATTARMAVHPAALGLDPNIAARFFESFFME